MMLDGSGTAAAPADWPKLLDSTRKSAKATFPSPSKSPCVPGSTACSERIRKSTAVPSPSMSPAIPSVASPNTIEPVDGSNVQPSWRLLELRSHYPFPRWEAAVGHFSQAHRMPSRLATVVKTLSSGLFTVKVSAVSICGLTSISQPASRAGKSPTAANYLFGGRRRCVSGIMNTKASKSSTPSPCEREEVIFIVPNRASPWSPPPPSAMLNSIATTHHHLRHSQTRLPRWERRRRLNEWLSLINSSSGLSPAVPLRSRSIAR